MAKVAFTKEKIAEIRKSKNSKNNSKGSTPKTIRKWEDEKLIENEQETIPEAAQTQRPSLSVPR